MSVTSIVTGNCSPREAVSNSPLQFLIVLTQPWSSFSCQVQAWFQALAVV